MLWCRFQSNTFDISRFPLQFKIFVFTLRSFSVPDPFTLQFQTFGPDLDLDLDLDRVLD